ncbi:sensor histidine kinase [Pelagicoccus sp. SDUM812003]|uniref:sensor histidine kinase n=1 Tax=Pelagicoccus sp. SDUM812003 TaxID=3041267 RepID=UPI00280C5345|nr:sensor histidine kinase [Pelagicoccus sp. SDUM812003]MDQ8204178.1 sensor histidine kinase [Pelagicoccus sp. SDUM812003]
MRIASKIRLLTLALLLSSTGLVTWMVFWGYLRLIDNLEALAMERQVAAEVAHLEAIFDELRHDIHLLEGLHEVERLVVDPDNEEALRGAELFFRQLLRAKPYYDQVRLIGEAMGGRELVRADRRGGALSIRQEEELQDKAHRDYYQAARALERGQIYFSPINLNREFGEIELPHRPTLRVAMPLYSMQGAFGGIVIINVDFGRFMAEFIEELGGSFEHFLGNQDGDYLVHPDASKTYGFDLGQRHTLQADYPELAGFVEAPADDLSFRMEGADGQEDLFYFRKVRPFDTSRFLIFGLSGRFEGVIESSQSILFQALTVIVGFSLIALVGTLWVASKLTRPIAAIAHAARRFSQGDSDAELPTGRDDEIGTLASTFESMRRSLREQETRILAANSRLLRTNRDLEHFTHISSHGLREPLTRIGGLASLLERQVETADAASAKELAQRIVKEVGAALRQVSDFRVFSKLGKGRSIREEVSMDELVRSVVEEFEAPLRQRGVVLRYASLPRMEVYSNLVAALYRNLLENALKFSEGPDLEIAFTCEEGEKAMVFGVRNTGSTIAEEHRNRVFGIFNQIDPSMEGSGVGLAVCRRVVERHRGKIWIESGESFTHVKFTFGEEEDATSEL